MVVKSVSIILSVFILAFVINYKILVLGEDIEESCENENQLNVNLDEGIVNETLCDEAMEQNPSEDIKNSNSSNVNSSTVLISCILNQTNTGGVVEIVNASKLGSILQVEPNVTNRKIPGSCLAVLFYSPSCPFSCMAAPHFNALPRFFPDVKMVAINAMKHKSFNAQFGVVGTPTLILFHSGRPAVKLNDTSEYDIVIFAKFISKNTGLVPTGQLVVTSADFSGPVSSIPVKETDYYLLLSWLLIAARVLYSLYYSTWGRSLVDATLNAWREAEAQHHHAD